MFSICSTLERVTISTSGSSSSPITSESPTTKVSDTLASKTAKNMSLIPLITESLIVVSIE